MVYIKSIWFILKVFSFHQQKKSQQLNEHPSNVLQLQNYFTKKKCFYERTNHVSPKSVSSGSLTRHLISAMSNNLSINSSLFHLQRDSVEFSLIFSRCSHIRTVCPKRIYFVYTPSMQTLSFTTPNEHRFLLL